MIRTVRLYTGTLASIKHKQIPHLFFNDSHRWLYPEVADGLRQPSASVIRTVGLHTWTVGSPGLPMAFASRRLELFGP